MIGLVSGLVLGAGGAIWALLLKARLAEARHDAERLRSENESLRAKLGEAEASGADRAARLETVIADYKHQVAELDADLAKCQDPVIVRERLRRLLEGDDAS
jgi:hypothetical protein